MAEPHGPCYGGWNAADLNECWRVDFNIHVFTQGTLSCTILPVYTADGSEAAARRGHNVFSHGRLTHTILLNSESCTDDEGGQPIARVPLEVSCGGDTLAEILTVVVTSSFVKSHPSTRFCK